ncbi:MAG: 2-oxoisovalerate dehydrogenase [Phycisphaera sp.]|nr:2-oxoisovalerate dehydrogenase [Phycisphaera sp.]
MSGDEIVFLVEEDKEAGGFTAACSRWGIYTQGQTLEELREMVKDAVACRFEPGEPRPQRISLHVVHDEVIAG